MLKFHCTHCNQRISAPDKLVGTHAPCPTCGGEIVVPQLPQMAEKQGAASYERESAHSRSRHTSTSSRSHHKESSIWRNIAAIPAGVAAWFVMNWVVGNMVLRALMGEDMDRQYFLLIIPVQSLATWAIPLLQSLLVPAICIHVTYHVATSKRTYFGVVTAIILGLIFLLTSFLASLLPSGNGALIARSWIFTVVAVASIATGLVYMFKEDE